MVTEVGGAEEALELKRDLYVVVLDESGSMEVSLHSSREALTAFHAQQRATSLPTSPFKIFTFNNKVSLRFNKTIGDALAYSYRPTGGTALHDAIGFAINDTKALVATMVGEVTEEGEEGETGGALDDVYIIVITDGFENASKQFNEESVKALIEEQIAMHDWKFIYLAANQDSAAHGSKLGFDKDACLDFAQNHQQTRSAVKSVSSAIHRQKEHKRREGEEASHSLGASAKPKSKSPNVKFSEQERFASK